MKFSRNVKPISFLKAHASEMVRAVEAEGGTMIITQNGKAKAILQDIHVYEQTQDSLALLKILALSHESLRKKKTKSVRNAFRSIRKKIGRPPNA